MAFALAMLLSASVAQAADTILPFGRVDSAGNVKFGNIIVGTYIGGVWKPKNAVQPPSSSVSNNLASFSDTTGTILGDSGVSINLVNPAIRLVASGTTDTLGASDYAVSWTSSSAAAKTQTIPACSSANARKRYVIVDGAKTAGLYNIGLTPQSGTIDGQSSQSLQISGGSLTIHCDGTSNWVVE